MVTDRLDFTRGGFRRLNAVPPVKPFWALGMASVTGEQTKIADTKKNSTSPIYIGVSIIITAESSGA